MKPERINAILAEFMGIEFEPQTDFMKGIGARFFRYSPDTDWIMEDDEENSLDFCNNLELMAVVREKLKAEADSDGFSMVYHNYLLKLAFICNSGVVLWKGKKYIGTFWHATRIHDSTAEQQAIAAVKALNKWEDS